MGYFIMFAIVASGCYFAFNEMPAEEKQRLKDLAELKKIKQEEELAAYKVKYPERFTQ